MSVLVLEHLVKVQLLRESQGDGSCEQERAPRLFGTNGMNLAGVGGVGEQARKAGTGKAALDTGGRDVDLE